MFKTVRVVQAVLDEMRREAEAEPSYECCGLLGGTNDVITHVFPADNLLESGTRFEIAPEDIVRIFRDMRDAGLEHLGIYHSHPTTDNEPSARDVELSFYPETVYFIISPREGVQKPVRAFLIRDSDFEELEIQAVQRLSAT